MPDFDLSGKVAVVTRGSRGLGREIAFAYARHGASVVIASRKVDTCATVAEEITLIPDKGRSGSVAMSVTGPNVGSGRRGPRAFRTCRRVGQQRGSVPCVPIARRDNRGAMSQRLWQSISKVPFVFRH
jgi:NAD(P)-dependent dehydrogenase (short-subunit alcohol dehydrogenase family)